MKPRMLLDNYYLPGDLERQIGAIAPSVFSRIMPPWLLGVPAKFRPESSRVKLHRLLRFGAATTVACASRWDTTTAYALRGSVYLLLTLSGFELLQSTAGVQTCRILNRQFASALITCGWKKVANTAKRKRIGSRLSARY